MEGNFTDYEDGFQNKTVDWSIDYLQELDTSQYPFPNNLWHLKPPQEIALKTTFMVIIGIVGLFLNSIILIIISKNSWLWTATNMLIANMALIDLVTLLLCPWFMLVRDFYQNYVLGYFGCRFEGFFQATLLLSSVGAVMLVSYDRMAAAALTPDARITKKAAKKLILLSWVMAILFSTPWVLKRELIKRQWLDHLEIFCLEDVTFLTIYWHIKLIVLVWTPLGLTTVAYGTIMWKIEMSIRKLKANGTTPSIGRARGKALRITACVLAAAIICRIPYSILIYWRNNMNKQINAVDGAFSVMWFLANYLMYMNSALNPLIYGFTNERFLRAMDRTPGIRLFKFGSWCCKSNVKNKMVVKSGDKNTEKIFIIENSPKYERKFGNLMKNMLNINKNSFDCSVYKVDEITNRPTKITPLKNEI